eukprot:Mycagemm_TRINITY_DN10290_c0_g16::TRINITY_DN10290_c0_g16_i1::g.3865::m.3865 type:complete len:129 gc:universal TRINITY_DN10290_c0_g16_i1:484-98(-)
MKEHVAAAREKAPVGETAQRPTTHYPTDTIIAPRRRATPWQAHAQRFSVYSPKKPVDFAMPADASPAKGEVTSPGTLLKWEESVPAGANPRVPPAAATASTKGTAAMVVDQRKGESLSSPPLKDLTKR